VIVDDDDRDVRTCRTIVTGTLTWHSSIKELVYNWPALTDSWIALFAITYKYSVNLSLDLVLISIDCDSILTVYLTIAPVRLQ
jgi:hypothetical protein